MVIKLVQWAFLPIRLLLLGRPTRFIPEMARSTLAGRLFLVFKHGTWWVMLIVLAVLVALLFIFRMIAEILLHFVIRAR